ncbi:MAG: hypothetical protein COV29_04125, partial [Candidatus Yanofskybacteria bacterium CG10_big_fil_rev_8_21_14_0_10_36_16]
GDTVTIAGNEFKTLGGSSIDCEWDAPDGTPNFDASCTDFDLRYTTSGLKTVTYTVTDLDSHGTSVHSDECTVNVTGTPTPTPTSTPTPTPTPTPTATPPPIDPPTNLQVNCDVSGTSATFSWDPVVGAVKYAIRIDNQTNPFPQPGDDENNDVLTTSYTFNGIVADDLYSWWLHSINSSGVWSDFAGGPFFICTTPIVSVAWSGSPLTGIAPLDVDFIADVTYDGSPSDSINYSVWWNCNDPGNNVGLVSGVCGALPNPALGSCASNSVGYKCEGVLTDPLNVPTHTYSSAGSFWAKVIVERGTAVPDEDRINIVATNNPPSVTGVTIIEPSYCETGPGGTRVSWVFNDDPGETQSYYQIQVDDDPAFASPNADSGKTAGSINSQFLSNISGGNTLSYNTTYHIRIKVWDQGDVQSAWSATSSFTVPTHPYPDVDFSYSPFAPAVNQLIGFNDESSAAAGYSIVTWLWDFGDGNTSPDQNPEHSYLSEGIYNISLTVTDSDGLFCTEIQTIGVGGVVPFWKEVAPKP